MKNTIIILLSAALLASFTHLGGKKVLYIKTGTYTSVNGEVTFIPNEAEWRHVASDTSWRGFIIKQDKK